MPFFRNQRQFQQLAYTAFIVVPVVTAIENTTLSSQVTFSGRFQYQSHTEPAFTPTPPATVDSWIYPWTDPVRVKVDSRWRSTLAGAPVTAFVETVPPTVENATISSPVIFKKDFIYSSYVLAPFQPSEVVTADKWIYPWSEPVRQKPGLRASLQQAAIGPVLDVETQIINTFESRWHYPWSEPVRIKPQLPAGEQQFYAYPPIPDVDADSWLYAWSSPVRFRQFPTHEQQAQIQGPVQTPEFITVDKWIYPWTDPVRQKIGLKTHLQQAFIAPVLDNTTQIINTFESPWHFPWSEPVRFRQLSTAQQQTLAFQPPSFEILTIDKWGFAWSEPVRQKPGLKTHLQQSLIATTLDNETQIIQTYESRWHFAWSEPVRIKPQLPAGEQQTVIQGPVQTPEFITVDKWIYAWTDPVRQKIGLGTHLQQAFIAPVLDNETQLIQGFESRWHYAWSEPVRFRQLSTAQQQTVAFQPPSFEVLTIDKWGFAWSEPVRQKPGLRASLQQAFIATTLDNDTQIIQTFESRWHFAWSEPVRIRPQVPAGEQQALIQPTFTPEFITVDKWIYPWSDPVKQKIGIAARLQQAFIAPVLADEQLTGTIESRWHQPWSEPVRFRRFPTAEQQSFAAPATSVFETITVDKWIYPWADPVKQKVGLKTNLQQAFIGLTLNPETQIIQSYESRWHQPWSEPTRSKISVASQPSSFWSLFTPAAVAMDWFSPWQQPARKLVELKASLQQALFFAPTIITTETVPVIDQSSSVIFKQRLVYQAETAPVFVRVDASQFESSWHQPWSEPSIKQKLGLRTNLQQSFIATVLNPETQITQNLESRWHFPWSEPKRFKLGLGAWLQDTTTPKTPIFPTGVARLSQWFAPLSEPVRLKIGLLAGLQKFFQTSHEVVLPDVFVTLSATEVNNDTAFFGVTVYNAVPAVTRVPTTVVSIKEIPAVRTADTSIEEQRAIDNAAVSIEET